MSSDRESPQKPGDTKKRTLSDDDVHIERKRVVRTATSIKGGGGAQPDDHDQQGPPATDHDS